MSEGFELLSSAWFFGKFMKIHWEEMFPYKETWCVSHPSKLGYHSLCLDYSCKPCPIWVFIPRCISNTELAFKMNFFLAGIIYNFCRMYFWIGVFVAKNYISCLKIIHLSGLGCTDLHLSCNSKQERIPVGCVPAARWPYAWVCFGGGVPKEIKKKTIKKKFGGMGVPSPTRTRHPPPRSRHPPRTRPPGPDPPGTDTPLDQTPPGPDTCPRTRHMPPDQTHAPRPDTCPRTRHPPCGQTDACKNITLATTSLRPVKKRQVNCSWITWRMIATPTIEIHIYQLNQK